MSAPVSSNFTTPLTMVIAAPVNLYAFPLKPDAITLQWDYPSKSHSGDSMLSPITHFGVRCQAIDSTMASLCSDTSKAVLYKTRWNNLALVAQLLSGYKNFVSVEHSVFQLKNSLITSIFFLSVLKIIIKILYVSKLLMFLIFDA